MGSPEIDPHVCGHLIFDRGAMIIQRRKDSLFRQWCWNNQIFVYKKEREKGMLNGVTILENNPLEKVKATHSIILA